jgi:hypothetical protein
VVLVVVVANLVVTVLHFQVEQVVVPDIHPLLVHQMVVKVVMVEG